MIAHFQPDDFQVAAGSTLPEKLLIVLFFFSLRLWLELHEKQV